MVKYRKNRWTKEEEDALLAGINKYGTGKWMDILEDPLLWNQFVDRSNVDLKDKWRNMKNKEKSVTQKHNSASIYPGNTSHVVVKNEPSPNSSSDTSDDSSRCDAIVLETIGSMNHEYGSDLNQILSDIQERYEVPENFRKVLSESLKILVSQGKLEKVRNRYKISDVENKLFKVAAEEVATRLAEADNKALIAAEAIKEAKRMKKLAKESQMMLHISLDINEQCALGEKASTGTSDSSVRHPRAIDLRFLLSFH
ncbi:unnamed protein product [Arabis nemorensis]|uniref:MYB transcription factor n=1 Tax=Arabis nemorensis TaxID=586526 RepID=A0A565BGF2_9BRAS|nr:unnamed protein product [Arabis nemorensis]